MQINITTNNILYKSYAFWNDEWFPDNVCDLFTRYSVTLLIKIIPMCFLASLFFVSLIYTIAVGFDTADSNGWLHNIFAGFAVAVLLFLGIFLLLALLVWVIFTISEFIVYNGKEYSRYFKNENVSLIRNIISSKVNKFCVKINVTDTTDA